MMKMNYIVICLLALVAFNTHAQTFTKYEDTLNLDEYSDLKEALQEPEKVQRLALKNKRLKEVPVEVFQFPNLIELDLRGNKIKSLPADLGKLKKLRYLNISRNDLDSIPASVGDLKKLTYLEAGQNQIRYISPYLMNAENLQYISLWENELSRLPNLKKLEKLKEVDLRSILLTQSQRDDIKDALPEKTVIFFSPDCNCGK